MLFDDDHDLIGVALFEALHSCHSLLERISFLIRLDHSFQNYYKQYLVTIPDTHYFIFPIQCADPPSSIGRVSKIIK